VQEVAKVLGEQLIGTNTSRTFYTQQLLPTAAGLDNEATPSQKKPTTTRAYQRVVLQANLDPVLACSQVQAAAAHVQLAPSVMLMAKQCTTTTWLGQMPAPSRCSRYGSYCLLAGMSQSCLATSS
jgi:hypothetical protein